MTRNEDEKDDWKQYNDDINPHNGEKIDNIIVSQDMSYVVTYSKEDKSICGWVEENGNQLERNENIQPLENVGKFKLDVCNKKLVNIPGEIAEFILFDKILLIRYNI